MDKDIYFLKKTFSLAKKGLGFVSPNPLVGAVIVKNNRIIGEGYHKKSGFPHAEIEAIKRTKESLKGATLYINLEPCCHFGKTPPCVDKIIESKIKRVVISNIDPNPKVKGKSILKLKKSKIEVKVGLCKKEGERLNEVFFKNMRFNMPFVALKVAQSLDGKIRDNNRVSKWITDKPARTFSKKLRDIYDAVLVGINTVIEDNPKLNGFKKIPFKIVLDRNLRIPLNCNLLSKNREKVIIITSFKNKDNLDKIPKEIKVLLAEEKDKKFNLKEILKSLYSMGINSILIEGGSKTSGNFFDERLIDKVYIFIAPKIIAGSNSLSSIEGSGFSLKKCPKIKDISIEYIGDDILISGYPDYGK